MSNTSIANGTATSEAVSRVLVTLSNVNETKPDQWSARCPAHEDNRNSLCIGVGDDGRTLLYCQAGCATADVVSAVGLTMRDLMPPSTNSNGHASNGKKLGETVEAYDYCDTDGALLYQVVRFDPKDFRQRRPKPGGDYVWNVKGVQQVPYHLPELLAAGAGQVIYVVEGERDVEALERLGLVATTNAGGCGKWKAEFSRHLKGRRVVILPDNDSAGRKHAQQVALSLRDEAKSVKVVDLPGLKPKGDVSDWLASGETIEQLAVLVEEAAEWEPSDTTNVANVDHIEKVTKPGKPPNLLASEGRTESANAQRFIAKFGERVRYVGPWKKWIYYDGKRWREDQTARTEEMAQTIAKDLFALIARLAGKDSNVSGKAITELMRFARATASAKGVQNLLHLARGGLSITTDALDADAWLLNVKNGTIDLRTGELRPHDRADMLTKMAPVIYDSSADCKLWLRFLARITAEDKDLSGFLRRAVGMSIVGAILDHVLLICHGTGANGKTVFLEVVQAMLGEDYAMTAPHDFLLTKHGEQHPTQQADLFGKRLVACSESGEGRRLDENLVKTLTGGDTIRARRMREDFWQFHPSHCLWLMTNHKPEIRGTDFGIWRRLRLVPFAVTIPEEAQDKRLVEKLKTELSGILNWAIMGCVEWQRDGLGDPDSVKRATAEYRSESDIIAGFLAEKCVVSKDVMVLKGKLYLCYITWCEASGEKRMTKRQFSIRMQERGFESYRTCGQHAWRGVEIQGVGNDGQ